MIPFVLGLLAVALYLPGFWWGAPYVTDSAPFQTRSWGTDDMTPLGPLADANNLISPRPDRNLGYPMLHPFMVLAVYAPYVGVLWLTGGLSGLSGVYPFGLSDPTGALQVLTYIAHFLSVLLGTGIVLAAYDTGRILRDNRLGVIAALLVMVLYPMFYYVRTGNIDIAMLFFIALTLAVYARCLRNGLNTKWAVLLGVFGGLAVGTKEQAFAVFLPLPVVLLAIHWHNHSSSGLRVWGFWKPLVLGMLAFLIAFGLGSGLLVSPERYFADIEFANQRMSEILAGKVLFLKIFPNTIEGNLQLARLMLTDIASVMTLLGVILSIIGILLSWKLDRRLAIFSLSGLVYIGVLFFTARTSQLRYLLPTAYVLVFPLAYVFIQGWKSNFIVVRALSAVLFVGIFGVGLLRGIDLAYAMMADSRYASARWLEKQVNPGDQVEYFGISWKLPPIEEGVTISPAIPYYGGAQPLSVDHDDIEEIKQGWAERQPDFIIIMPDYTSQPGSPYSAACPTTICEGLLNGSFGYKLAAYYETPSLIPWVSRPALDYPTVNPPIRIFVPSEENAN